MVTTAGKIGYVASEAHKSLLETSLVAFDAQDLTDIAREPKLFAETCITQKIGSVIVLDGALSDRNLIKLAIKLEDLRHAAKTSTQERAVPVLKFVADSLRDQHDPLFTMLFRNGVTSLAGRMEGDADYNMYAQAVRLATTTPTKSEVSAFLLTERELTEQVRESNLEGFRLYRDRAKYDQSLASFHGTKSVVVFQTKDTQGSTHTAIGLARALRACDNSVALVLPPRHYEEVISLYRDSLEYVGASAQGINLFGLAVYVGEAPGVAVGERYDYVVCDVGTVTWWMTQQGRSVSENNQKSVFETAEVLIWASHMSPTGGWQPAMKSSQDTAPLDLYPKKCLSKTRFAICGIPDEEMLAMVASRISLRGTCAGIVSVDNFYNPFRSSTDETNVPEGMLELLSYGILRESEIEHIKECKRALESLEEKENDDVEHAQRASVFTRVFGSKK